MILWLLQHIPQIIINLLIEIGLLIFLIGNFVPMKYLNNRLEELVKLKVPSISGQLLKTIGILLIKCNQLKVYEYNECSLINISKKSQLMI
jgi:hypothetical protein